MRIVPLVASLLMLCLAGPLAAQTERMVSAGFWNVENLFDTIPSPFYDDGDYTPAGRFGWNTERYHSKITRLGQVIDSMSLDILGLAEVENEEVVRDLVRGLDTPYNYIHYNTGDGRGLDLALLFKGDRFFPEHSRLIASGTSRQFLYVRGEVLDQRVDIIVCHLPSRLNKYRYRELAARKLYEFTDSLLRCDPAAQLIVMGDFNCAPDEKPMRKFFAGEHPKGKTRLYMPLAGKASKGQGSYAYRGKWNLSDGILLSPGFYTGQGFTFLHGGIFIRQFLLDYDEPRRRGFPLRTFTYGTYRNGFSDHLPMYIIFG